LQQKQLGDVNKTLDPMIANADWHRRGEPMIAGDE